MRVCYLSRAELVHACTSGFCERGKGQGLLAKAIAFFQLPTLHFDSFLSTLLTILLPFPCNPQQYSAANILPPFTISMIINTVAKVQSAAG